MAKKSIPTDASNAAVAPDRALFAVIDSTPVEFIGDNPQELLTDAMQWRMYVRGIHKLVEILAANSLDVHSAEAARDITSAIGAARVLNDLADATFDRACSLLNFDHTGATA